MPAQVRRDLTPAQGGVTARGARTACDLLQAASRAGFTAEYWPVVVKMVERQ